MLVTALNNMMTAAASRDAAALIDANTALSNQVASQIEALQALGETVMAASKEGLVAHAVGYTKTEPPKADDLTPVASGTPFAALVEPMVGRQALQAVLHHWVGISLNSIQMAASSALFGETTSLAGYLTGAAPIWDQLTAINAIKEDLATLASAINKDKPTLVVPVKDASGHYTVAGGVEIRHLRGLFEWVDAHYPADNLQLTSLNVPRLLREIPLIDEPVTRVGFTIVRNNAVLKPVPVATIKADVESKMEGLGSEDRLPYERALLRLPAAGDVYAKRTAAPHLRANLTLASGVTRMRYAAAPMAIRGRQTVVDNLSAFSQNALLPPQARMSRRDTKPKVPLFHLGGFEYFIPATDG